MTTAGITNEQVADIALCLKTLEWPREQITLFLLQHWQVERLSQLTADQAAEAVAALVEAVAVWATPEADPAPALPPTTEDADWAALSRVDRPAAPALLAHVAAIESRFATLHWHAQHQTNYLKKNWRVAAPRQLTIAQADACLDDLDQRLALMPQGGTL